MASEGAERRLAAIVAADVAGYSRMLGLDEFGTLKAVKGCVGDVMAPIVEQHGGRIVKTMGDGVLAHFESTLEALLCAVEFQRAMAARNAPLPSPQRVDFRIGVNVGDIILEGGDVFGDVVNVAARLEAVAQPGGVSVTARVREDVSGRAALAFDDAGEHRLKNIERPVRVFHVRLDGGVSAPLSLDLPNKPSIAVLPFDNLSGDPEQAYFADGVTEDIISALSRWRWFFVIARNSSFIYKDRGADVKQIGRELGVRYLLEGSVRRAGQRVRVSAKLIDTATGAQIWSQTYDREIADLFALQDEITENVVAVVEPAMVLNEGQRMGAKSVGDLTAFECAQRGMWHMARMQREDYDAALACFRESIARDPQMGIGHTGLSRTLQSGVVYGFSTDDAADLEQADQAAKQAAALDPQDFHAHYAAAGALLYLSRHAEALDAAERALALNPNFAYGHFRLGQILLYLGRSAEAVPHIKRSLRHNPYDPHLGSLLFVLAIAEYHAGNNEEAIVQTRRAIRHGEWRAAGTLGAALARSGRFEEARAALPPETLARLASSARLLTYARSEDLAYAVEGMLLAAFGPTPAGE